jgi:GH24 family phage-related lysozyme (muramidase)
MTYASVRSAAQHIARTGTITPHQLAALSALDESLSEAQRRGFTELWRAEGSPSAPRPEPEWLAPALKTIKAHEGCRLTAYSDAAGVMTIGWGLTQIGGRPVKKGETITQAKADAMLRDLVVDKFAPGVLRLIPSAVKWKPEQLAAITSFAYNVGLGQLEGSTLRRRLNAGESAAQVVAEELPRWNKAGGKPLPGLIVRRDDEVQLFTGVQLQQRQPNPLQVPWYGQLDSATDQARRMCFSSSCAMLLQHLKPGTLKGPNGDDQYLKRVLEYGDTTSSTAQIQALRSYGVKAKFVKTGDFQLLEQQITRGIPVPCGYLHRGPVSKPAGGGHWLTVVGYNKTSLIVHDPLGEADLAKGTTISSVARFASYSRKNWAPRWMVEGPGTGWAIIASI